MYCRAVTAGSPTHCEPRSRRRPARHRGQYCFPAITAAFGIPVTTIQWVVICCAHLRQSLTRVRTAGRRHRAQTRLSLWSGMECHQLIPVWLGSHVCLLFFRMMQGIGTALLLSCAPALVTLAFPEAERGTALGVYTMLSALASTLGPLLGGQFALWGWPAVFYFRVPLALIAAVLTVFWVQQPVGVRPGTAFRWPGSRLSRPPSPGCCSP